MLCSQGKSFCAGADFTKPRDDSGDDSLYREAVRLFSGALPVVAAVQGIAMGGGLGLACTADFRIAAPESRFAATFARIGLHHGFGLTVTLPRIVGNQRALELLYTGRRVDGETAHALGLSIPSRRGFRPRRGDLLCHADRRFRSAGRPGDPFNDARPTLERGG